MNEKGHQATHGRTKGIQNVWEGKGNTQDHKSVPNEFGIAGKRQEKSGWIERGDNNHIVCRILTARWTTLKIMPNLPFPLY